jgi:hypothetical protein
MAEAVQKRQRRASGPRQARPIFGVVSYTDENGNDVLLAKERLVIKVERDAGKLLELVTGENAGKPVTVVKIDLPQAQKKEAPAAGATA